MAWTASWRERLPLGAVALAVAFALSTAAAHAEEKPTPLHCEASETKAACVDRLRTLLRDDLAKAREGQGCIARKTEACDPTDACGFEVLSALKTLGGAASPAVPEFVSASEMPNATFRERAVALLSDLDAEKAVPFLKAQLGSPDLACRRAVIPLLQRLPPWELAVGRAVSVQLTPFLEGADWDDRLDASALLALYGDPRTAPALIRALGARPFEVRANAADALAKMGAAARPAVAALRRLAQTHWSSGVRRSAAKAATALTGKVVSPRPPRCESVLRREGNNWSGKLGDRSVTLEGIDPAKREIDSACPAPPGPGSPVSTLASHGDCVQGFDLGEFGGALRVVHDGVSTELLRGPWLRVARLVEAAGDVWVLTHDAGLAHPRASLTRVHFNPGSGWTSQTVDRLPGEPVATGRDDQGRLILLVADDEHACPGKSDRYVLAAGPDGELHSVP